MLYFSHRKCVIFLRSTGNLLFKSWVSDVPVFIIFFSFSTLLGLHEYVQSRAEKRKVLQEIQQTKSHELVGIHRIWCSTNTRGLSDIFVGNEHFPKFVTSANVSLTKRRA